MNSRSMRRSDREVRDAAKLAEILDASQVAHLAFLADGEPAIVPMSFGYEQTDGVFVFYFHSACSGRKWESWNQDGRVELEVTGHAEVVPGVPACRTTCRYASVIAGGRIELLDTAAAQRHGLDVIMRHCGITAPGDYPAAMLERTAVWKLTAERISGKSSLPAS